MDTTLKNAVAGLMDAGPYDNAKIAEIIKTHESRSLEEIQSWREGRYLPSNEAMSNMLRAFMMVHPETMRCPNLPRALEVFWTAVHWYEDGHSAEELDRLPGETTAQRVTRFTTGTRQSDLMVKMLRCVPANARPQFFDELEQLVNSYARPVR